MFSLVPRHRLSRSDLVVVERRSVLFTTVLRFRTGGDSHVFSPKGLLRTQYRYHYLRNPALPHTTAGTVRTPHAVLGCKELRKGAGKTRAQHVPFSSSFGATFFGSATVLKFVFMHEKHRVGIWNVLAVFS